MKKLLVASILSICAVCDARTEDFVRQRQALSPEEAQRKVEAVEYFIERGKEALVYVGDRLEEAAGAVVDFANKMDEAEAREKAKLAQKRYWSLAALGDTLREINSGYCPVSYNPELSKLSNYIAGKMKSKEQLSLNDILAKCVEPTAITDELWEIEHPDRYDLANVDLYFTSVNLGKCTMGRGDVSRDGCALFVRKLASKQNELVKKGYVFTQPGTYVKCENNYACKIVDAVPGSEIIYKVDANGKTSEMGRAWTKDMFVNISADNNNRGAYNRSYILNKDLTSSIYRKYNALRGTLAYSVNVAFESLPGGLNDIKDVMLSERRDGQSKIDAHTNGFLFMGRYATAEWLGHFLYGMCAKESVFSQDMLDGAVNTLACITSAFKVCGESSSHKDAAQMGMAFNVLVNRFAKEVSKDFADAQSRSQEYLNQQNVCSDFGGVYCVRPSGAVNGAHNVECYCNNNHDIMFILRWTAFRPYTSYMNNR